MSKTKTPPTKKQARLLRRAVRNIERDAKRDFRMSSWFTSPVPEDGFCKTSCCLAGQIVLDEGFRPSESKDYLFSTGSIMRRLRINAETMTRYGIYQVKADAGEVAQLILEDAKGNIANALFHRPSWPYRFRVQYLRAATKAGRVKALKDRVEHYIQTGK